ncbi:MAG: hypothetical protein IMZ64_05195 [Bacteroidetes bacterium]|nr:hypothetical protein [Bacteroidota bacterium]
MKTHTCTRDDLEELMSDLYLVVDENKEIVCPQCVVNSLLTIAIGIYRYEVVGMTPEEFEETEALFHKKVALVFKKLSHSEENS